MLDTTKKMKQINIRVDESDYAKVKANADTMGLSLAQFVRSTLLESDSKLLHGSSHLLEQAEMRLKDAQSQLSIKDNQITELHKLVAMANTATTDAMRQLESSQKQLEDLRTPKPSWWARIVLRA